MIPKRIIYVWFGGTEPLKVKKNIEDWQKKNPDFELLKIDETNFDVNAYAFTAQAYRLGYYAFVSDVARIWAVNKFGGIYLDTDVHLLKPLEPLLKYDYFFAKEDVGMVASGLCFGGMCNNAILIEILNKYQTIAFNTSNLPNNSTVHIISKILRQYGLRDDRRTNQLSNNGIAFKPNLFAPLHYWGGGKITTETIAVHQYDQSWTTLKTNWKNYLMHQIMYYLPPLSVTVQKMKGRR